MACETCREGKQSDRGGLGQAASPKVIAARRISCATCDKLDRRHPSKLFTGITDDSVCMVCDCPALTMTKLARKSCPLPEPRWTAEQRNPQGV